MLKNKIKFDKFKPKPLFYICQLSYMIDPNNSKIEKENVSKLRKILGVNQCMDYMYYKDAKQKVYTCKIKSKYRAFNKCQKASKLPFIKQIRISELDYFDEL